MLTMRAMRWAGRCIGTVARQAMMPVNSGLSSPKSAWAYLRVHTGRRR